MAGVGAALGWIDPTLAFFIAPFFGLGWTALATVLSRFRGSAAGVALPYGPHLAAGVLAVVLLKPWLEQLLTTLAAAPIDVP
jgi:prepilin signal peptidase PulO-like enzyme (type II secretory pathway)